VADEGRVTSLLGKAELPSKHWNYCPEYSFSLTNERGIAILYKLVDLGERLMYAVIEVGGKQYRVSEGGSIEVARLPLEVGDALTIDRVLLLGGDGQLKVGTPTIEGARVKARVTEHGRGRKVIVFKFKTRNRYQRKQGHRQEYTRLAIESILTKEEAPKRAKPKKKATPLEELGLSARTINLLRGAKISSVEALRARLEKGDETLLSISGFGPKALEEVKKVLEKG
jgi:large subunit ribosomal protein L21